MNTNRFYLIVIVALLCCNLVLVYFLISGSHGGPRNGPENRPMHGMNHVEPKRIIIEKLNFDKDQIFQYEELIKVHFRTIQDYDRTINELKKDLYIQLKDSSNIDSRMALINKMGDIQKQIEQTHFDHFLEIKELCKPEQIRKFNSLSEELVKLFNRNNPPK
jgi:Spy/CpxP family protein refolding chaperone